MNLVRHLRKLEVKDGDVIQVVLRDTHDRKRLEDLVAQMQEADAFFQARGLKVMVLFTKPGESIRTISEEEMKKYGWAKCAIENVQS